MLAPVGRPPSEKIASEAVFDPEKAKQFMADAGYPNGEGFPAIEIWYREEGGYNGAIIPPMAQYVSGRAPNNSVSPTRPAVTIRRTPGLRQEVPSRPLRSRSFRTGAVRSGRKRQMVKAEMPPGSLFVSNSFPVPEVEPNEIVEVDDGRSTRLYCYRR